jgi:hypothetical protein
MTTTTALSRRAHPNDIPGKQEKKTRSHHGETLWGEMESIRGGN